MKKWAWIVAGLYGLVLAVLAVPVTWLAFAPGAKMAELCEAYVAWQFWLWIGLMILCQAALLVVPVNLAGRRPVTRRSLLWPVVTAGLMMGGLTLGLSVMLFSFGPAVFFLYVDRWRRLHPAPPGGASLAPA
jgi:hypothetical protein